jgi:hypothetical protein
MPKALSTHSYGGFSGRIKNIGYVHRKEYDLGRGVMVRLHKETSTWTQYAGWGLQAVTDIKKGFVLGYFVLKKEAKEPEEGTYNIRKPNGRYLVMEHDSLMNRINAGGGNSVSWCLTRAVREVVKAIYLRSEKSIIWLENYATARRSVIILTRHVAC